MADDVQSVVEVGRAQRGDSDWPRPGDEGFVHPDGTEQSERQMRDNRQAAANRAVAGSGVHGAPARGGVRPGGPPVKPSALARAQAEHTEWVHEAHAAPAGDEAAGGEPAGRHETPAGRTEPTGADK